MFSVEYDIEQAVVPRVRNSHEALVAAGNNERIVNYWPMDNVDVAPVVAPVVASVVVSAIVVAQQAVVDFAFHQRPINSNNSLAYPRYVAVV